MNDEDDFDTLYAAYVEARAVKDYPRALESVEGLRRLDPESPHPRLDRAAILMAMKDWRGAVEACTEALGLAPDPAADPDDSLLGRGAAHVKALRDRLTAFVALEDWPAVVGDATSLIASRAIRPLGGTSPPEWARGRALFAMGSFREALVDLDWLVARREGPRIAVLDLRARVHQALGDITSARADVAAADAAEAESKEKPVPDWLRPFLAPRERPDIG